MLILPAEADEAVVSTAVDRIAKIVGDHDGEIKGIDRWGRRRFAYEVNKTTEGYYAVVTYTSDPETQSDIDRVLNLADEVIRHKTLLLPEKRDVASPVSAPAEA
jgi:small subunit ribosomal protein S6